MPQVAPMDNDNRTADRQLELNRHRLKVKLDRLLRVKEELWEECQPVPRELEDKIHEVRQELDRG